MSVVAGLKPDTGDDGVVELSRDELWSLIESEARYLLGCSAIEAFQRLERGEYASTAAADELLSLKSLYELSVSDE